MIRSLIKISGKKLLFPLYHSVSNNSPIHLKHLYRVKNMLEFETDIDFILRYFKPIDTKQLIEHINEEKPLKNNSVLFTFDDGLREMYDVIFPILLKKGIPAIFFINSEFVDNKDLFYRYKASLLIHKIEANSMSLKSIARVLNIEESIPPVKKAILNINYLNKQILDELAEEIEFSFNDYLKNEKPYLTINDLSSLQKKGFVIGAHSVDHPEYFNLSLDQQINQTITSINWVKNNLNPAYNLFAFPFTDYKVSKAFFDMVFGNKDLNLDLTFGCAGIKDDYHKQHFQRLPMEDGPRNASKIIQNEYQKYLLKKLVLKNKVKRN